MLQRNNVTVLSRWRTRVQAIRKDSEILALLGCLMDWASENPQHERVGYGKDSVDERVVGDGGAEGDGSKGPGPCLGSVVTVSGI